MPTLKLHFPEEFLTEENKEDMLAFVNKGIPEKSSQFKSFTSWMRGLLRTYAAGSMQSLRQWKNTGTIVIPPNQMFKRPELKMWQGDGIEELNDGLEGKEYPLTIGSLQYDYLKKAVVWENTYQREILESAIEHRNVAALARHLIISSMLQVQRNIDEEKLRLEEEKLTEEEEKEKTS